MREFLLLALKGPTNEHFALDYRSESAIICRTIFNAFWASRGIRRDTNVYISLNGGQFTPRLISFFGAELEDLPQSEQDIANLISRALLKGKKLEYGEELAVFPGIKVAKKPFETVIKEKKDSNMFYLHPRSEDIRNADLSGNTFFVLGDLFGIPDKTEKFLKRYAKKVTLGPIMLFAAHCPVIVQNELDRRERSKKPEVIAE